MTSIHGGAVSPTSAPAFGIRRVAADEPYEWIAEGWRDFKQAPAASVAYGLIFVVAGWTLTVGLWRAGQIHWILPLACGFMLIGPVLTLGFHAIGRDLEQGRRPSVWTALRAWRANPEGVFQAAFAFLFLFLVWLRLSQLLFALTFPVGTAPDAASLARATFHTLDGWKFLALFVALGAAMAALAFAGGAFALPMLLDRPVGVVEAIGASVAAVRMNLPVLAIWAILLVALVALGTALAFVGLAVTLPVAGLASWRAYRAVFATG